MSLNLLRRLCAPFVAGVVVALVGAHSAAAETEPLQALYVTDWQAFWHDYPQQATVAEEVLPRFANVELTVVGKQQADSLRLLTSGDFALGYDLVIYNLCLTDNDDWEMVNNIIRQTRDLGVPAVLMHCAIHSFRKSSSQQSPLSAWQLERDKRAWADAHPSEPFPTWWQFTGLDSTSHDFARGLTAKRFAEHPITRQLPASFDTSRDELYRNIALTDQATPLYSAFSAESRVDHIVAWTHEVAGTRLFATTLGHGEDTHDLDAYYHLLANGILWATGRLQDNGWPAPGYEGRDMYRNYQDTVRCNPSDIVAASTIADVQQVVRETARAGKKLKVVSLPASNSNSGLICPQPGGRLLTLEGMDRVISVDRQRMEVTVEPGIRLVELSRQLHEQGLAISTMPDYTGVGVAGGIATAAHHSSLRIASSVADQVRALKIVDATGQLRTFRGDDVAKAAVHLGLLGVVVEVTLKIEDQFKLRYGFASGRDDDLERDIEGLVRAHDYARVSWFAGVGRYVLEYFDRAPLSEAGTSRHNMWSSTGGVFRIVGNLPYDIVNKAPLRAQCDAALLRSTIWLPTFAAENSPRNRPVGLSHQMLGSYCEPGSCPWDADGVKSRTMEVAFPLSHLSEWMADVRAILKANRGCFPLLGLYLRFSKASDRHMAFNYGTDVVSFEIHVPKVADESSYEQSAATYDEIVQMTVQRYNGRPHWGKNSTPLFVGLGAKNYPKWDEFVSLKRRLDPNGMFENRFWQQVTGVEPVRHYPACVLARACICRHDSDCGTGYSCVAGGHAQETRVCRKR